MTTQFPTTFLPDDPTTVDARYRFTNPDREKIDAQILGLQSVVAAQRAQIAALVAASGAPVWWTGTDASYAIQGVAGTAIVEVPALTLPRTWVMPSAPNDGMIVAIYDKHRNLVSTGNTLSLTTGGGTDHFWVGGVDKGTTWLVDALLFQGSSAKLVRRAATNTWEMAL